jgi:hypothetical protein
MAGRLGRRAPGFTPAAALLAALALWPGPAPAEKVGVTAAVNPQATGTPPKRPTRKLHIGARMVRNERIRTYAKGRTQLLFVDGSALTVGPNADLVLDEFVYDPDRKTGKLAMTATKGVFRFVGGRISKTTPVILKTPTAVIGIRGGIALVEVGAATTATFLFGEHMSMTAGNVTRVVKRPGFEMTAEDPDAPPGQPRRVPGSRLAGAVSGLEGVSGSAAGASRQPVDEDVAKTQLAAIGSAARPAAIRIVRTAATPPRRPEPPAPTPSKIEGRTDSTTASQQQARDPVTTQQNFGNLAGRYKTSPPAGPNSGTGDGVGGFNRPFSGGGIVDGRLTVAFGEARLLLPVPAAGGSLSFAANAGTSPFGAVAGTAWLSGDGDFFHANLTEVGRSGNRAMVFAGRPTPPSAVPTTGLSEFDLSRDFVMDSDIPFIPKALGGDFGTASVQRDGGIYWDISGSANAQRAAGFLSSHIAGSGGDQVSAVSLIAGQVQLDANGRPFLTGGVRGSSRPGAGGPMYFFDGQVSSTPAADGSHLFGTAAPNYFALQSAGADAAGATTPSATKARGQTAIGSHFGNNIAVPDADGDSPLKDRLDTTLNGFAAGIVQVLNSGGGEAGVGRRLTTNDSLGNVAITTSAATNKLYAQIDVAAPGSTSGRLDLRFGDSGGGSGRSVYIDSEAFGAIEAASGTTVAGALASRTRTYMFVDDKVSSSDGFLPGGVGFCTCEGVSWGFWGGEVQASDGKYHRVHLGTWVAGDVPSAAEIAGKTGTASYDGHLIGTVTAGSGVGRRTYLAAGRYQTTYDFDSDSGSVSISSFDGTNYSGNVAKLAVGSEHRFSGSVTADSGPSRSGDVQGVFFNSGGNSHGAMGGQVSISQASGNYKAAANFAAELN